jgi:alpha-ketoglutarate-dependent taurine dioxygenase
MELREYFPITAFVPPLPAAPGTGAGAATITLETDADALAREALLDRAWEYACLPENTYVHNWRVGDVLMWDNRVTMHRRDPFDGSARRVMHRTQIQGAEPPLPAVAA